MRSGLLIILTPGLNFDAICLYFNAVLAMGHIRRQIAKQNSVNNALVATSSFSAQWLPSLTMPTIKWGNIEYFSTFFLNKVTWFQCNITNLNYCRLSFSNAKTTSSLQSFPYKNHCKCLSSHRDLGPCYFTLTHVFLILTLLFCWKIKSCDCCFHQQIWPQTTVQLYIAIQGYSSVRIGFNMINKRHILPIVMP